MTLPSDRDLADADFIPSNEPDATETLRRQIRMLLHQGSTPSEITAALVQQGVDSEYAAEMVKSVLTTGRYAVVETEQWFIGGLPVAPATPTGLVVRRGVTPRQRRLEREASGQVSEPNPDLAFEERRRWRGNWPGIDPGNGAVFCPSPVRSCW
jgi:hypothetical protein